jgi:hypothetical protein
MELQYASVVLPPSDITKEVEEHHDPMGSYDKNQPKLVES